MSNVPYTIFNIETGRIRKRGTAPADELARKAREGEAVIEGDYPNDQFEIAITESGPEPRAIVLEKDPVLLRHVEAEADRRLSRTDWMITRAADPTSSKPVPEAILNERATIRAAFARIATMDPIPDGFRDDAYWTEE